ncbi:endonuclease MutS2, partial [bacterium]
TMIITGSNTGGKTVSIKTLGLCALMVKVGLYLPTKTESDMAFFNKVLADIGDEQSLEQNLSTFSGHLTNINKILINADDKSLVMFDEIGTGTDPAEGAAIAQAIIEELRRKGSKMVITTHYGELKTLAYNYPGISNASVEFDIETLSPTYRLLLGVPGKSNAVHIAKRLGVMSSVVERARELLKGEKLDINISVEKLESEYKRLLDERKKLEELNQSIKEKEKLYETELTELEEKKKKVRQQLFEKFEAELADAALEVKEIVKDLQMDKNSKNAEKARNEIQDVAERLKNRHKKELEVQRIKKEGPEITVGEYYYLAKVRQVVQVLEKKDSKVEVQAGLLKLTVNKSDLSVVEGKELK